MSQLYHKFYKTGLTFRATIKMAPRDLRSQKLCMAAWYRYIRAILSRVEYPTPMRSPRDLSGLKS